MADLKYSSKIEKLAEQVGFWIAKNNAVLIFGAEKDSDSLSTAACRGAKRAKGFTIGVTYGKGLNVYEKNVDVVIASGLERGGGREFPLVLSCDAIIALSGGSGTLTEIAIAYQANIPIVVLDNTGGWSKKLANTYLDERKRIKIETVKNPREAVNKAIRLASTPKDDSKLMVLTSVHGDEKIGKKVLSKLEKDGYKIPWMIANERADKGNKRFIDADLNRIAPGNKNSKPYESRRAFELVQKLSKYENVIDIHGTISDSGIFTIVTNPTPANLMLAGCLPIKNVVIWPSKDKAKGPLVSFVKRGVEIECGPKNSRLIEKNLYEILKLFAMNGIKLENSDLNSKNIFKVYGKLPKKINQPIKDFKKVTLEGETFYPLLVDQYEKIKCYKMRKINILQ